MVGGKEQSFGTFDAAFLPVLAVHTLILALVIDTVSNTPYVAIAHESHCLIDDIFHACIYITQQVKAVLLGLGPNSMAHWHSITSSQCMDRR